jgi:acetoin utilization protein AcuB
MTPFPHSIDAGESLAAAEREMARHGIRHLPVRRDGELVGVVSDRDLKRTMGRGCVEDVMTAGPYVADIREELQVVLATMAERHIGCALVLKEGRLAGIYTTTDACRGFAELLRALGPSGGDEAA